MCYLNKLWLFIELYVWSDLSFIKINDILGGIYSKVLLIFIKFGLFYIYSLVNGYNLFK